MDRATANMLIVATSAFYEAQASSFSATRQSAWAGWERVAASLAAAPRAVLDVACGNQRFLRFLEERFPEGAIQYRGVDSCSSFAEPAERLDIARALLDDTLDLGEQADMVACFGFMHHVPGLDARVRLMRSLCDAAAPGGLVAVSFWRFMESPELAQKALVSTEQALAQYAGEGTALNLDEGDYLLGWQDAQDVYRYCHNFTSEEVDALAAAVADRAEIVDQFFADGRTGALNEYIVLRRR